MAVQHSLDESAHSSLPMTIILSDGETITLDEDYFQQQTAAVHARLAAPPLSDEELARRRAASPDETWLWTRRSWDAIRCANENDAAGRHGPIYTSDEELQAALDHVDADNADV